MGIARVTVVAAEFAPAVRVHGPAKRDSFGIAVVQYGTDGQQEILGPALGFGARGGSGEACNADQFRSGLRTPAWRRRGSGSFAGGLTGAVASGCGEKGETGLFRPIPATREHRRIDSKYGRSGHCEPRCTGRMIFAFCSLCQAEYFAFISPVREDRMPIGTPSCESKFQPQRPAYTRRISR